MLPVEQIMGQRFTCRIFIRRMLNKILTVRNNEKQDDPDRNWAVVTLENTNHTESSGAKKTFQSCFPFTCEGHALLTYCGLSHSSYLILIECGLPLIRDQFFWQLLQLYELKTKIYLHLVLLLKMNYSALLSKYKILAFVKIVGLTLKWLWTFISLILLFLNIYYIKRMAIIM